VSDIPACCHTADVPGAARYLVNVLIDHGVDRTVAYALPCADVHPMTTALARANYLARADRILLIDTFPPARPPAPAYSRGSQVFALTVMSGMILAVLIMCTAVWRFYQ